MKLSICIPVYNFDYCLSETLDTIVTQPRFHQVELCILDGASTDNTPKIISDYHKYFPNIKYIRRKFRGGIDRDMAYSVSCAMGDYCWLFSGDDFMFPGAIEKVLYQIQTGLDLYLTKHLEWVDHSQEWMEWPTVDVSEEKVFELSDITQRRDYFHLAKNTEAFFSFIGGIVLRRAKWESVALNEVFVGTCWAHAARFFELMPSGLSVKVLSEPYLKRRPDNDSFSANSITKRFALTIDGFTKIANFFYGHESVEAAQIRRVLRNEYHPLNMLLGKFLCQIDPQREDILLMDRLVAELYGENTLDNLKTRFNYARVTPKRFRRWQPVLASKFDAMKHRLATDH